MGNKKKLRELYEAENKYENFFTGGTVKWTHDGSTLLCQCNGIINVLEIAKGAISSTINKTEDRDIEDTIYTFALSEDNDKLVTSHKSGLLKLWSWRGGTIEKSWKSVHNGYVVSLNFNHTGNMVVSGGSDGGVRVWDIIKHTCIFNFRDAKGVIDLTGFHPSVDVCMVFASGNDHIIYGWNIKNGKCTAKLSGHYNKVTSLVFHSDKYAVSCSRDKVIILWHIQKQEVLKTIPAFEPLEGIVLLQGPFSLPTYEEPFDNSIFVATVGQKGYIRIWNVKQGCEIYSQQNSLVSRKGEEDTLSITHLMFNEVKRSFCVVTVDHNIIFHDLETFECEKQLVGFSDEIFDIVFIGEGETHLAVASNSIYIKLYDLSSMDCQLLQGHADFVLALATTPSNPNLLVSCGKDKSVHVWMMNEKKVMQLVLVGTRHTASVGSIALSNLSPSFFISVSQDSCIKLWSLPQQLNEVSSLIVAHTQIAHEKDINCVAVSPNDEMAATGSQDRTVKVWSTETLSLLGILRGHKRGVWSAQFSPVDNVLLTSSADCTIKIWSLDDLCCLKTFEGHEASVLQAVFISHGTQIVSTGADGLLKVWYIKTSECLATFDEHDGKIWALAVQKDGQFLITGDSNSTLVKWKDTTKIRIMKKLQDEEKKLAEEQELSNLLRSEQVLSALEFALSLDRPRTVLRIIQDAMLKGDIGLMDSIRKLNSEQKESLLKLTVSWNTNSKNSQAAQIVISSLLGDLSSGTLQPLNFNSALANLLPYTERHFKRLTKLSQDLYILRYTLSCMNVKNIDDTRVQTEHGNEVT